MPPVAAGDGQAGASVVVEAALADSLFELEERCALGEGFVGAHEGLVFFVVATSDAFAVGLQLPGSLSLVHRDCRDVHDLASCCFLIWRKRK